MASSTNEKIKKDSMQACMYAYTKQVKDIRALRPCEQGLAHLQETQSQAQGAPLRRRTRFTLSLPLFDQMDSLLSL